MNINWNYKIILNILWSFLVQSKPQKIRWKNAIQIYGQASKYIVEQFIFLFLKNIFSNKLIWNFRLKFEGVWETKTWIHWMGRGTKSKKSCSKKIIIENFTQFWLNNSSWFRPIFKLHVKRKNCILKFVNSFYVCSINFK